ncbi:hypothetical protein [uncultured Microbulbifer sp.]|uniref:hypothetical protein n=1 Tax=uncultured Microbulbifer sp. TaxID=348147 RepID=UPI002625BD14|nr:hypothetical protein [uncultured Microbulbifer sp.]
MAHSIIDVLLRVGEQIEQGGPATFDEDGVTKPAPVAPLYGAILDFSGSDIFEFVDTYGEKYWFIV